LVQGEPTEYDSVINADGMKFAVESIYDDVIDYFDVDYYQGVFRKGFVVYANGARGC
jgi:Fe-S cluster assembly iron-binding protein IscA